ncbi:glucokinase [Pseudonocardia thermophila]|jgi:ROK family protein (putative glucokinase)|uniref:Glucokinase n=1 Tax=Pseudonocardia thermophila TaxID=1848 RepID=A0A1M6VXY2_PSETH|nr:ROK family glucokinase [Pseudonocardia thermophila]SHK86238.1 glucokinase [Pseudonocardia thermophila]
MSRGVAIGVDVGGTSVRAGVVDADGTVLDTVRTSTPGSDAALEDAIAGLVETLARRHRVTAVGLALAGFITPDLRGVRFAPHLSWRDAPVADRISARIKLPVVVEHDANAAALGERYFGAAAGASNTVFIALGTGIGSALLLDGSLYRGAFGVAPELGHLRVVPDGRPCPCGKSGCWERYCSGTALATTAVELLAHDPGRSPELRRLVAEDPGSVTGRRVAAAALRGDPVAVEAMADLARWLGEGLALVADVFDPELVVIGGGVSGSAPLFLDEAREHYAATVTGAGNRPLARIRTAQLGEAAAVVGAAQLAREQLRRS